ncbi:hypothetical protein [Clostridium sp. E02]|uniref:hypothetical protein n=1 Tax=Clostridium sp. E02 TaxID=2487134 RepID=UPI000F5361CD|nr:hypothetical protein [Clostridium sp. E02]
MSKLEFVIYLIFAYLPFVSIIAGIILLITGTVLKFKGAFIYKKIFLIGGIFIAIFFLCIIAILAMGFIGVGPGMSD